MTATATLPYPTIAELLDAGDCTPGCLTAAGPPRGCTCSCGGRFHGVVRRLVVPAEEIAHAAA